MKPSTDTVLVPDPEVNIEQNTGHSRNSVSVASNKIGPVIIDLSDDDDSLKEDKSQHIQVKIINELCKSLTTENSAEVLAKSKMIVKKLPRDLLEHMFCTKLQENVTLQQHLHKVELKVTSLKGFRDRVRLKAQFLQRQITDSAGAMLAITNSLTQNPKKGLPNRIEIPLKYQRTVGVQCCNIPLPRLRGRAMTNIKFNASTPPKYLDILPGPSCSTTTGPESQASVQGRTGMKRQNPQDNPVTDANEIKKQISVLTGPKRRSTAGSILNTQNNKGVTNGAVQTEQNDSTGTAQFLSSTPNKDLTHCTVSKSHAPMIRQRLWRDVVPTTTAVQTLIQATQHSSASQSNGCVIEKGHAMNEIAEAFSFILPPLPSTPVQPQKPKEAPPRPKLTLQIRGDGIVLSWTHDTSTTYAEIQNYQVFACREHLTTGVPCTPVWRHVADVKSLPLPMACTLSQFTPGNRFYFSIRGVDVYYRTGEFSEIVNTIFAGRQ